MPYINPNARTRIDIAVDALVEEIAETDPNVDETKNDGRINYAITRLLMGTLGLRRYHQINTALGVLEYVKQEIYRRVAAPYEDEKACENGDVF